MSVKYLGLVSISIMGGVSNNEIKKEMQLGFKWQLFTERKNMEDRIIDTNKRYSEIGMWLDYIPRFMSFFMGALFIFFMIKDKQLDLLQGGIIGFIVNYIFGYDQKNKVKIIDLDKNSMKLIFFRKEINLPRHDIYSCEKKSTFAQEYIKIKYKGGTIRLFEDRFEKLDEIYLFLKKMIEESNNNFN